MPDGPVRHSITADFEKHEADIDADCGGQGQQDGRQLVSHRGLGAEARPYLGVAPDLRTGPPAPEPDEGFSFVPVLPRGARAPDGPRGGVYGLVPTAPPTGAFGETFVGGAGVPGGCSDVVDFFTGSLQFLS